MVWNRRLWITADVPGDDTPFHTAGNTANHPETVGADPHMNDMTVACKLRVAKKNEADRTEISTAGNAKNHHD